MSESQQTPDELRITQHYLGMLDVTSRCTDAVRQGQWDELHDAAQLLARRALQLAESASNRHDRAVDPRTHVVIDLVASRNSDSEAARLLHPHRPSAMAKTTTTMLLDPFQAAAPVRLDVDNDPQG